MVKREIKNLELKIKLTNEYLREGGYKKIHFLEILNGLKDIKFVNGEADPESVSPPANAFMMSILQSHMTPPSYSELHISEYASTLQKATSFDQQNIDTIEQFNAIYEDLKERTGILYRGQREAKWRLYSSLQRNWIHQELYKSETYQSFLEKLVTNGKAGYGSYITEMFEQNNIDTENDISILGFLQHHGCPTPLLDWTYKFQNALFFAIEGVEPKTGVREIEEYCSIYYLEEEYLHNGSMRSLMNEGIEASQDVVLKLMIEEVTDDKDRQREMYEHFKGRAAIDRRRLSGSGMIAHMTEVKRMINIPIAYFNDDDPASGIVFSLNNNKNILSQEGVFIWNSDPTKPLELIGNEQYQKGKSDDESEVYRFCSCFNIHKDLVVYIKERLAKDGVTRETIYPTSNEQLSTWNIYEKSKSTSI